MIEKTKNYFKDNFLEIMIAALVAAFFAQYQLDRGRFQGADERHDKSIEDLKVITYNLAEAWTDNKQWRNAIDQKLTKHDEEFMEIWKMMPRGARTKTLNIDNP